MTQEFKHRDKIHRPIKVGDPVAYPSHNSLMIGFIVGIHEKMVRVRKFNESRTDWKGRPVKGSLKYPNDLVLIDGQDITMYLLKYGAKT